MADCQTRSFLHAVFCGLVAVFRDCSVVHTDTAQACISLGQAEPSLEAPPAAAQEAMASAPPQSDGVSFSWRLETQQEADERATAEAKADPVARRKAAWAARYALLLFAHSMVCHTKKRGQKMQFAAVRRVCCTLTWRLPCARLMQIPSFRIATPGASPAP